MAKIHHALCAALVVSLMTGPALGCHSWDSVTVADARAADVSDGPTTLRLLDRGGQQCELNNAHVELVHRVPDRYLVTGTDEQHNQRRFWAAATAPVERRYTDYTGLYVAIAMVALAAIVTPIVVIETLCSTGDFGC